MEDFKNKLVEICGEKKAEFLITFFEGKAVIEITSDNKIVISSIPEIE